jgi:hypothetical protein
MLALILMLITPAGSQDPVPATQDPVPAATQRPVPSQGTAAVLLGCENEGGRPVCRYQMPEIRLMEQVPQRVPGQGPGLAAAPDAGSTDPGVLSEAERRLVLRCADAGWLSLCLPQDRRQARALKASADAYDVRRREISAMLAAGQCDAAVNAALSGGYLALGREVNAFCGR